VRWAKAAHVLLRYYTICVLFITQITWSQDICDALRLCAMPACGRWFGQSVSLQIIIGLQQYLMASRGEQGTRAVHARPHGCCGDSVRALRWRTQHTLAPRPRVHGGALGHGYLHRAHRARHQVRRAMRASVHPAHRHGHRVRSPTLRRWRAPLTPAHRLAPIIYDALLLVLTVRGCTRGLGRRAPLLALLFRDGLWAFLAVFGAPRPSTRG
jgi:hypothetical protein